MSEESRTVGSKVHDVVIIGGGLAGLSVASELQAHDVVVLEREDRVGGRVMTVAHEEVRIDLGACFAFNPEVLPQEGASVPGPEPIRERGVIGIHFGGVAYFANDAWGCIELLPLDPITRQALVRFRDGAPADVGMPPDAKRVLNAFFKQIHPGDISAYTPERQRDALANLYPDHWSTGNGAAVDSVREASTAEIRPRSEALRIEDGVDSVRVAYRSGDQSAVVEARLVVVATPATVARELVPFANAPCLRLLDSVRYGRYAVVALVLDANDLAEFRFIVTPDLTMTLVMQQGAADRRHRTLLCYYDDIGASATDSLTDEALIDATLRDLDRLRIEGFSRTRAVFSRVQRWVLSGTLLTPEYDALRRAGLGHATNRIFLAGDYVSASGWGYGMDDAVASGRATGAKIRALLGQK